jgi:putative transcriptional regulator
MMTDKELQKARLEKAGIIKARRKELGLTQQELADRCQLGLNTIKRLEEGKFWPVLKILEIVAKELKLKIKLEEE